MQWRAELFPMRISRMVLRSHSENQQLKGNESKREKPRSVGQQVALQEHSCETELLSFIHVLTACNELHVFIQYHWLYINDSYTYAALGKTRMFVHICRDCRLQKRSSCCLSLAKYHLHTFQTSLTLTLPKNVKSINICQLHRHFQHPSTFSAVPFSECRSSKRASVPGRRSSAVGGRWGGRRVIWWRGWRRAESLSWRLCGQQHTLLTGTERYNTTGCSKKCDFIVFIKCLSLMNCAVYILASCLFSLSDSEMHCVYLKSVRSPAVQGKFKMSYRNHHNMDIFSQVYCIFYSQLFFSLKKSSLVNFYYNYWLHSTFLTFGPRCLRWMKHTQRTAL